MKAIVIGHHNGEIPGIKIIEKRNIPLPETSEECKPIFESLLNDAFAAGAALIFQALPGQMAATITRNIGRGGPITHVPVGVVVLKLGEISPSLTMRTNGSMEVVRAAEFANPNVRWDGDTLVVDQPMQFVFSHIEYLSGG